MLEKARQINGREGIEYRREAFEDTEFPENSFDVVICSLMLHYLASYDEFLEKIHRWLKPDGVLAYTVEHPIFYNTCKHHHFHVPIYARVLIRDVRTLEPLPMGQAGLVNLITPLNRATPVTSVVTDDLGVLRPGEDCGCGINSPYLTILGRVGMPEIQTCAAGAAELLGKGEGFS